MTDHELLLKSIQYRRDLLRIIFHAGAGHTGGSLSCVDILNVLYNRVLHVSPATFDDPHRDRYIQSKGHSVEALYVVLADRGFFPKAELDRLCRYQSPFVGHPTRKVPGIEMNTGALGHGLVDQRRPCDRRKARRRVLPRVHASGRRRIGRGFQLGSRDGRRPLQARQSHCDSRPQHAADHGPNARRVQQRTGRRKVSRIWLDCAARRWP